VKDKPYVSFRIRASGMATAPSVGSCPRAVCRLGGRRAQAWRSLRPSFPPPRRAERLAANASPAGKRVLTSSDGEFHVSYGTPSQLRDISDTQALAFFEPIMPVLDPLFLQYFKADVSVTLDRKYEYLDSRRFAPLVATCADHQESRSLENDHLTRGWRENARFPARRRAKAEEALNDDVSSSVAGTNTMTKSHATAKRVREKASPVVGVVELSIQRDPDVVEKLPMPPDAWSSMWASQDWADGAGPGGDLETWAANRARARGMRPRPGRWKGGAPADEYAYVSCMCVKENFRRRGVADALLRAAEKVALEWGYDCAALHVFRRNEAAIRLYRGRGYEIVDDSYSPVDAVLGKKRYLMVKTLR